MIEDQNIDIQKLKDSNKRKKGEIENLTNQRKELTEELSKSQNQIMEIINENESLKDKQKDFYNILQGKINEISLELKYEREARIGFETKCRVKLRVSLMFRNMKKL